MNRANPQINAPRIAKTGRIAAVQEGPSGGLAILIAEIGGTSLNVVETVLADRKDAAELFRSKRVDLVIRLAPSSETVCKLVLVPEGSGADRSALADALALMAESELPASLPWYRRAGGVVRVGSAQAALLTGWTRPESPSQNDTLSAVPEVWAAEIAALAALAAGVGGSPMVGLADQRTGTVALLASGGRKAVARVLRLANDRDWSGAVHAAWDETAAAAGVEGVQAPAADGLLLATGGARLGGATRDREWINRFGLAMGAAMLYADGDAAVSALVALALREPRSRQPLAQRTIDWLSLPRHAAVVGAACLAVALLAPLASSKARHAVLASHAGSADALDSRLAEAERRVGFYKLLSDKRWPMTKLLAQIAGAAPVGVTLDAVELPQGETVTIRATAESSELVSTFRKNLSDTRVFTGVATPTIETTADGVTFQLQARVVQNFALQATKPLDDFAAQTLAQRLYGESANNNARYDRDDDRDTRAGDRRTTGRDASRDARRDEPARPSSGGSTPSRSGDRAAAPAPPPASIPPPLSDEDIARMDRVTAMREWGVRRRASTQPGIDAETKARLTAEAEKARVRMQEAGEASPGGGS